MEKQTQRIDLWTWREERRGEGEMYGKNNIETYIAIYKIDSPWKFALWLGKLKQGLCINLDGWHGAGDGSEFQNGGDIYIYIYIYIYTHTHLWLIHVEV